MDTANKTREQLVNELAGMANRVAELEALEAERQQVVKHARARAERLAAINRIAHVASAALDLDVLAERVYQEIMPVFQADVFLFALYDDETNELDFRLHVDQGERLPSGRLALGTGLSSVVVTEKRPLVIRDLEQERGYLSERGIVGMANAPASWMGVPLLVGERVVGIISVQAYRPYFWGDEDEQLLLTIADRIAIAMENAALVQERERCVTELTIVNEIGRAISSTTGLDDVLETVYRQVSRLFDAANFCISAYMEESDEWIAAFFVEDGQVLPRSGIRQEEGSDLMGCMIRGRQSLLFRSEEEITAFLEARRMETTGKQALSWLGVPLVVADRVVGGIAIQSYDQENLYDERDAALLSIIAVQVAPAFDHLQLPEETRRRAREMGVINEVGQIITSTLDLDAVLCQIVDTTKARFGHYFVSIALMEGTRLAFQSGSTIGDSEVRPGLDLTGVDLMQRNSLAAVAARTEEPVLAGDTSNDPRYLAIEELPDTRSELCVPIKVKGRVIGTLDVQSDRPFAYNQADVDLLQSLANQAGVAIENARLFEEARIRAEELTVLNELSQALTTRLSVDAVLEATYRGASHLLDATNFAIGLYDSAKGEINFSFTVNESKIDSQIPVIPVSQGLNGYVIRNRTPVLIRENVSGWQEEAGIESVGELALSWLGVPLVVGAHVLGAMSVQSFTTPCAYDEHDRDLLIAIASQTAIALQSARLYEAVEQELTERKQAEKALQESEEQLRTLVNSLQVGIMVVDAETHVITQVNPAASEMVGVPPEEIVGQVCHKFVCPAEEGRCPITDLEQVVDRSERVLIDINGKHIPILKTVTSTVLSGREHLIESFVDITERKQAQEVLQKMYTEVEKQVEERTAELQREVVERERLQQEVIKAQKQTLQELSTPIIPLMEGIIVVPLIGSMDSMRAREITRSLLAGIRKHEADVVILDITGVPVVDSGVVDHLNKTIQAARLKGARTIVTGISDVVAETIVDLGIDWGGIETVSDLQTGLLIALGSLNIKLLR